MASGNLFNKLPKIPPVFGLPREVNIDQPQEIPSNIWFYFVDDREVTISKLRVQCVPLELNNKPEANWAVIPSMGRNNPFYHYTGGEDILEFTIDWYSVDVNRQDVINKCRLVESFSRADGYRRDPPKVVLIFGDLFKYDTWVLTSAPYKLSLFDKQSNMLPRQAYQDITLRKVTSQNTSFYERQFPNGGDLYYGVGSGLGRV